MSARCRISEMDALTAITHEQAPEKPITKDGREWFPNLRLSGQVIAEPFGYRRSWSVGTL
jgi:hypothetical protein